MEPLSQGHCVPCEGGVAPLDAAAVAAHLAELEGWEASGTDEIFCDFKFRNYYQTIAFVNAIAWFSHQEDHHPDLEVSYNHCKVRYSTHAINGLSKNDFICAAKVTALFKGL